MMKLKVELHIHDVDVIKEYYINYDKELNSIRKELYEAFKHAKVSDANAKLWADFIVDVRYYTPYSTDVYVYMFARPVNYRFTEKTIIKLFTNDPLEAEPMLRLLKTYGIEPKIYCEPCGSTCCLVFESNILPYCITI